MKLVRYLSRSPRVRRIESLRIYLGHRVATQYLLSALEGAIPPEHLLNYRAANSKLPGHPELGLTPGVKFSSGRLGHMWPMVNGVALANRDKVVFCLGSDGSQQEGNDAEAARLAVAQNLNVKILIDDNDVTIAGHPSEYFKGYDLTKTLEGHGLKVVTVQGEDIDALWGGFVEVLNYDGPAAIVAKRLMGPVSVSGTFECMSLTISFFHSGTSRCRGYQSRPRCYSGQICSEILREAWLATKCCR